MNKKQLQNFFEERDFLVHHSKEDDGRSYTEVEKWTDGGVDMVFVLEPFSKESFIEQVNYFDIDEQIDMHRQAQDYKDAFTISESLKDFTSFHDMLKEVAADLAKVD